MARSVYVTAMGPNSGKSLVALGLMELLSRRVGQVGFFRPVIRAGVGRDEDIELIRQRYLPSVEHDELFGLTSIQVRALAAEEEEGAFDRVVDVIVPRFRALQERYDFLVCLGTDFTGLSAPVEFEFNARLARVLSMPVITIVDGHGKDLEELLGAVALAEEGAHGLGDELVATIVNRVEPHRVDEVRTALEVRNDRVPAYVVPNDDLLASPTLREVGDALAAELLFGSADDLDRPVGRIRVGAMTMGHLLEWLDTETLIITPSDRSDVILGAIAARQSSAYPRIAGLLLTGGLRPEPTVAALLSGLRPPSLPMLGVPNDTYDTARLVMGVTPRITADNQRKVDQALRLFEDNVDVAALEARIDISRATRMTGPMFQYELLERAKADRRHIVLPEGDDDRILTAADQVVRRGIARLTILGDEEAVRARAVELGLDLSGVSVLDPRTSGWLPDFAERYYQLRKHKAITRERAQDVMADVSFFGTMMVHLDLADGMVSGARHTTAHTIRPAFEFVRTRPGVSLVSSVFFMCLPDRVLVYGDCAVNPDPTAEELADIAISSAETARQFGIEPLVAMLSYSTGTSGAGEDVDKVRIATQLAQAKRPDLAIDGPLQYDAAIDPGVAAAKAAGSTVAGRATVFVFPDLNTGNNTYKAVQRSSGAVAIGPVLQGLNRPVNDLSRGATIVDVVNTIAITAIQAQEVT